MNSDIVLHRCAHCASKLISTDYQGRPVGIMDRALAWHTSGSCHPSAATANAVREVEQCLTRSAGLIWPAGEPPLVFFARMGDAPQALDLLRRGIANLCGGVDARGQSACTALHHAATYNATELISELLSLGASATHLTQDDFHGGVPGGRVRACRDSNITPRHLTYFGCQRHTSRHISPLSTHRRHFTPQQQHAAWRLRRCSSLRHRRLHK